MRLGLGFWNYNFANSGQFHFVNAHFVMYPNFEDGFLHSLIGS